jgi:hypothetical protein
MGCANSLRNNTTNVDARRIEHDRTKNLFYATTEFDLTESDNDDDIHSIKRNHYKQSASNVHNITGLANVLSDSNTDSSATTCRTLLDNRLDQTCL